MTAEPTYSHDEVWLLVHSLPIMDYARKQEPQSWKKFVDLISDETANVYPTDWNTHFTVNKMAFDLGSYKLLVDIWLQVEDSFDYVLNSSDK